MTELKLRNIVKTLEGIVFTCTRITAEGASWSWIIFWGFSSGSSSLRGQSDIALASFLGLHAQLLSLAVRKAGGCVPLLTSLKLDLVLRGWHLQLRRLHSVCDFTW